MATKKSDLPPGKSDATAKAAKATKNAATPTKKAATPAKKQATPAKRAAKSVAKANKAVNVTFTLPAEVAADTVTLCGEFNEWSIDSILLEREKDGSWSATVALAPGRTYRYRYLIDGRNWENAWQADEYVANPYGSYDSVVVVG